MPKSEISLKRSAAARLLPYNEFLDRANWTSRWCRTVEQAHCPRFESREEMYRYLGKEVLKKEPIDYLEFGVADGGSMRAWCEINQRPGSRFFGFDCFTGLPEDWTAQHPKGTFNRNGLPPEIGDARVRFHVGLFQESLPGFLDSYRPVNRLVIHNDGDLYSSTLYTLTMMDRFTSPNTVFIFDEFYDALHEFRALLDYSAAYRRTFRIVAAARHFSQVAVIRSDEKL